MPSTTPESETTTPETLDASWEGRAREISDLLMPYKFGLDEMTTKIAILREELTHRGEGNPIEHVSSRLKSLDSLRSKAGRMGLSSLEEVWEHVNDIAGIRIVCSFISDTYRVMEMLTRQPDLTVVQVKDYIEAPKPNGYRSIHLILEVPVHLSEGTHSVRVEVQIRTVAMDFWASVEHKIYYKFHKAVPDGLKAELLDAADSSHLLDQRMQRLHRVVHEDAGRPSDPRG